MKFKTYTAICRLGIDDLLGLSAYAGSWGQGDHYFSNNVSITHPDYVKFIFECAETQEAVNQELEFRRAWNEAYIKQLKESGEYGKEEEEISKTLIEKPIYTNFETKELGETPGTSWRMEVLDFGNKTIE